MATMKPIKIHVTCTCPLCRAELSTGSDVCVTKNCDYGKVKRVVVIAK